MTSMTEVDREFEARFGPGGNNPPSPIEIAKDTFADVSKWLGNNPVVETEAQSFEAVKLINRAEGSLREIEAERDAKVRPLNEKVSAINAEYKGYHNKDGKSRNPGKLDKIFAVLTSRLAAYMKAEEARREAEAERVRLAAIEAELIAQDLIRREQEALDDASQGVIGIDVAEITADADAAARVAGKADRAANLAERNMTVRLRGDYGRAKTLHNVETLTVTDAAKAVASMDMTEALGEAIKTAARAHRKKYGALPEGIKSKKDRSF